MPRRGWIVGAALACAVAAVTGCLPPGRRLLSLEVYQEGRLVLRTVFDVPDTEPAAEHWEHVGTGSSWFEVETARVVADDDPLRATLQGAVEIRIIHVDRVRTSASLTDLELVRESASSSSWHLPPREVARARRAAGH